MFHKHLQRQQRKGRECFCVLGQTYNREKEQNRCFLLKLKTEGNQICPDSSTNLTEHNKRVKIWRKHSLKVNQKENQNTRNFQEHSSLAYLQQERLKGNIFQPIPQRMIKFTYQAQPLSTFNGYNGQLPSDNSMNSQKQLTVNQRKDTESSTKASIQPTSRLMNRVGQKVSIFGLKKRLVTHCSANTDIPFKETATKLIKARAFSTTTLHKPQQFKFNPAQYASIQASHLKQQQVYKPSNTGDFLKLNQLCFKRAESVGESEEDHISEVQSNPSLILTQNDEFQPNWNFSLNQLLQKRKQRTNPQLY